jgi:hypothetical protein
MPTISERIKRAYNVLLNKDEFDMQDSILSSVPFVGSNSSSYRDPKSTILAPILNRIATDVAGVPIRHIDTNEDGAFIGVRDSELNERLTGLANIDQSGPVMIQDAVEAMLTRGVCAIVPAVVTRKLTDSAIHDILSMRVGTIVEWRNRTVRVSLYNEDTGQEQEAILSKELVAIVYNPFYSIMNRPNSTLQRLIDKLSLLDKMDRQVASSQLDIILQLPYQVRTEKRAREAEKRLEMLEQQLANSRYGIAYVDATEKITPLNRPAKYSLTEQVQYLYESLNSQLGLTPAVFSGTAGEGEMIAYYNRTIAPILSALCDSMRLRFLTKTARSQGQSIAAHPNLFRMSPIAQMADAADKFTRNEILSSNEIRAALGLVRREEPNADELRNKNISKPVEEDSEALKKGEVDE